jgi:fibronectin type 3 domain-containing protein
MVRKLAKFLPTFIWVVLAYACTTAPDDLDELGSVEQLAQLPPPTNLTVVNVRADRQDLTWTAVPGTVKHIIFRGLAGPGSETAYTECCLGTTNTFVADHLLANTQYCWQVANVSDTGARSVRSNEVCLTTGAPPVIPPPATVTAIATSDSRITVSWSAVAGATKYRIKQSEAGGPFLAAGAVAAPATTIQKANLQASTEYCYTVEVDTAEGSSVPSSPPACATTFGLGIEGYWLLDEGSGTVAADSSGFNRNATLSGAAFSNAQPKPPIDDNVSYLDVPSTATAKATTPVVSAFRLTGAFTVLFWANVPAGGSAVFMGMHSAGQCGAGVAGWEISQSGSGVQFISQTGTRNFGQSVAANTWTHVAVSFSGGVGGTLRMYLNGAQVASTTASMSNSLTTEPLAFGHVGNCPGGQVQLDEIQIFSRELAASEIAEAGTVPLPPTNLVITSFTSTFQNIAWTPPAGTVTKWIMLRAEGPNASGNETFYTHAPNPPAGYVGQHLTPNTLYAWQVITVRNRLFSARSVEVLGTTADVPAAPTGVTATALTSSRIRVDWQAVPNATKYYVQQSTDGVNFSPKGSVLAPTVTFTAVNLTPNTTYFYRVAAEDVGKSIGPFSATASATTLP